MLAYISFSFHLVAQVIRRLKTTSEVTAFKQSKASSIYMAMLQGEEWANWLWLMNCLNPYDLRKKQPAIPPGFQKLDHARWREWAKIDVHSWKDATQDVLNTVAELPTSLRKQVIEDLKSGDAARRYAEDRNLRDPTEDGNPKVS